MMIHPVSRLVNGPQTVTMADVERAGHDGLLVVHFTLNARPDTLVLVVDDGEVGPLDPELRAIAHQAEARFTPQLYGLEHCQCCGEPPDHDRWPTAFCVAWREKLPLEFYQAMLRKFVEVAPYDYCSTLLRAERSRVA